MRLFGSLALLVCTFASSHALNACPNDYSEAFKLNADDYALGTQAPYPLNTTTMTLIQANSGEPVKYFGHLFDDDYTAIDSELIILPLPHDRAILNIDLVLVGDMNEFEYADVYVEKAITYWQRSNDNKSGEVRIKIPGRDCTNGSTCDETRVGHYITARAGTADPYDGYVGGYNIGLPADNPPTLRFQDVWEQGPDCIFSFCDSLRVESSLVTVSTPWFSHWQDNMKLSFDSNNLDDWEGYGVAALSVCVREPKSCPTIDPSESWYSRSDGALDFDAARVMSEGVLMSTGTRDDAFGDLSDHFQGYRIDLSFDLPFFCDLNDRVWVSGTGVVSFAPNMLAASPNITHPETLPTRRYPLHSLAWFWTDVDPRTGGDWYYLEDATAGVLHIYGHNLRQDDSSYDYSAINTLSIGYSLYSTGVIEMHYVGSDGSWNAWSSTGGGFIKGPLPDMEIALVPVGTRVPQPVSGRTLRFEPNFEVILNGDDEGEDDGEGGDLPPWVWAVVGAAALAATVGGAVVFSRRSQGEGSSKPLVSKNQKGDGKKPGKTGKAGKAGKTGGGSSPRKASRSSPKKSSPKKSRPMTLETSTSSVLTRRPFGENE